MIRAALIVVGILAVTVLIVTAVGYALPRDHTASREAVFAESPERLFAVLRDVEHYPTWRSDVQSVEILAGTSTQWRERGRHGTITFELRDAHPPHRMVTRIADATLAFGGTWTYQLTKDGAGTKLVITENGEVYNPIFRVMSRFVFGHTATLDRFLNDLRQHMAKV